MQTHGAIPPSLTELRAIIAEESARQGVLAEFVALFLQFILRSLDALIVLFAEHQAQPLSPQQAPTLPTTSHAAPARPSRTPAIRSRAQGKPRLAPIPPETAAGATSAVAASCPPLSATSIPIPASQAATAARETPFLFFDTPLSLAQSRLFSYDFITISPKTLFPPPKTPLNSPA